MNGRAHKERAQPSNRLQRFGLLEKKKDYKLRADDYHRKERRIKALQARARNKNQDEFAFGMMNKKLRNRNGLHELLQSTGKEFTADQLLLLKSQDWNYLKVHVQQEKKQIEKLKRSIMQPLQGDEDQKPRHIIFVDDQDVDAQDDTNPTTLPDPVRDFKFSPELSLDKMDLTKLDHGQLLKLERSLKMQKQVESRQKRLNQLAEVEQQLALQRVLMSSKGKCMKMKVPVKDEETGEETGQQKVVYKWRQERKK